MAGDAAQDAAIGPTGAAGIYLPVHGGQRLYQGEILERVTEWGPKYEPEGTDHVAGAEPRLHALAIVLTQDCDLAQDWGRRESNQRADSDLPCVLMCPAWPADVLREAQKLANDLWKPVRGNKNERYQYLADVPKELDQAGEGHAALVLDFRSVFAVRTVELYRQLRTANGATFRRRFRLETPWAEHLQSRYASYVARIGLPRDHFTPAKRREEG